MAYSCDNFAVRAARSVSPHSQLTSAFRRYAGLESRFCGTLPPSQPRRSSQHFVIFLRRVANTKNPEGSYTPCSWMLWWFAGH